MIFVTVGTTPFDSLIKYVDNLDIKKEFIFQISDDAKYLPKNHKYFNFTKDIEAYYKNAEVVITHAGAGSSYNLLEMGKKIIIVPNLERVDNHQLDITNYMKRENYAMTCTDLIKLEKMINDIDKHQLTKYKKESFFKENEILEIINKEWNIL